MRSPTPRVQSSRHNRAHNDTSDYPIIGRPDLTVGLSTDPGSGDEVSVHITGPPDRLLGARIGGLMDAYQQPRTETRDGQD